MLPPPVRRALQLATFGTLLLASSTVREGRAQVVDQAVIWLPTGVAIAGLWLLGLRAWWVIALVTLVQRRWLAYDWGVGIPAAIGSTCEAVVGVLVLRRFGFGGALQRLWDVAALFAAAAVAPLGSILFSWIGRGWFWANPTMPFYSGWDGWWRMNALGALTAVPIALVWREVRREERTPRFVVGAALAWTVLMAGLVGAFAWLEPGIAGTLWLNMALMSVCLYAAARHGMRGVTLASSTAALFIAIASAEGMGPFVGLPRDQRHATLQLFELMLLGIPIAFGALITERRVALERGQRSEDLLASIRRNVREGLFRTDPDLRLTDANEVFVKLYGLGPADRDGWSLRDAFADRERRRRLLAVLFEQGQWIGEEVLFARRDGTTFWGVVSATVVRDAAGRVTHVDGAIADVTARKALEEQFRQAQKMEAVGMLAGGVAHDFNNLLTVIMGHAEAIRMDAREKSPTHEHAGHVLEASTRAAGLTRQLLAYSRRQVLSPRVLALDSVVDRMGDLLRRLIGEDIRLVVEHRSGPCWVRVDPSQIEQVLLNLAVNARDAMRGGGTLTIVTSRSGEARSTAVDAAGGGGVVVLQVGDTGVGMAPEVQARAFDPFFTTKDPGRGSGLGLATVYGIVRQSGGSIRLVSVPGGGTTVSITFPQVAAVPEDSDAEPGAGPPRPAATVLVAEDQSEVRGLVCRALRARGHHVLEAADGLQALDLVDRHPDVIDLIVTDVVMPGMGGRELAARLRERRSGVRVLFITGYAPDEPEAPSAGRLDDEVIAKPFTSEQLVQKVERCLGVGAPQRATSSTE